MASPNGSGRDALVPAVAAVDVRKSYPSGDEELEVLKGVGFTIAQGEFVAIMGPSGSGKSTLLNLIGILDAPSSGSLSLMGREVGELSSSKAAEARRDTLGFVFQSFNLMPRLSALQNVMLPMAIAGVPRGERRTRATLLLEQVGLGDRLKHRPNELSGGQKQRVAIARALALDPPILLADEPTGNLDSKTGAGIMELFATLNAAGKTVIQVTHDEGIARHAQRILRIRDGILERDEHVAPHARIRPSSAPQSSAPMDALARPEPRPDAPGTHPGPAIVRPAPKQGQPPLRAIPAPAPADARQPVGPPRPLQGDPPTYTRAQSDVLVRTGKRVVKAPDLRSVLDDVRRDAK